MTIGPDPRPSAAQSAADAPASPDIRRAAGESSVRVPAGTDEDAAATVDRSGEAAYAAPEVRLDGGRGRRQLAYETWVLVFALLAGLPGTAVAIFLLLTQGFSARTQWTFGLIIIGAWLGFAFALRERVIRPLQTLSNLLAALLEGDYSIRSRGATSHDALGLAMLEVNALGQTLREQRLGALEATALLRKVMDEIDVAVFAFDEELKLRVVNRAAERLVDQAAERMRGRTAQALGLEVFLDGDQLRIFDGAFPGAPRGRWEIRRSTFRQGGLPHQLLVISDVSRTLREEELAAWQRLIRVLSHEINNSLAPIKSIAGSLISMLQRPKRPADADEDLSRGLEIIAGRSDALSRFMQSYARLARLPAPRLTSLDVETWVRRVVSLETRMDVQVEPGPGLTIDADGDQLDQLLINLVRNAVDASLETGGGVRVSWKTVDGHVDIWVRDQGHGIEDTTNLFVPFFTTKPSGSGIGLALSRQITEAHRGTLTLENVTRPRGCVARLRLPIHASE
jgi:nitrogen fixation/metabolism regulation signal transduction histidine kinase